MCEHCWFAPERGNIRSTPHVGSILTRYPVQWRTGQDDLSVTQCCYCGRAKVTNIPMRENPTSDDLKGCHGFHVD
jgi:hypothetical protein